MHHTHDLAGFKRIYRLPIFDKVAGSSSRWQVEAMSGFGGSWWFLVVPRGSWWFLVVPSGS